MMLTELAQVATMALPIQTLKEHLRMGTGFADDGFQDGLVESHLRAALAAIEGRIGKALITRRMMLRVEGWRHGGDQPLPVAPISGIVSVTLFDGLGGSVLITADRYRLVPDMHRPRLVGAVGALPSIGSMGWAEVVFDAGFGATFGALPADLQQAVLLLAAEFYERRHEAGVEPVGLPFGVTSLIDRWRTVRVLGGGAA
ncbi:head-tail connector protein [Neogemmobacter tilapiae]|uniref:Phage gp6-like head-tail connector protein n=1 Tax=Neogemmobacter tilapiae TaxID=875041 RepID=A0A918TGX6_9RHOB|nr:hypothetical protein [Gemmobacter tilapiae]GHC46309.1 hypothetical protein GCM10007315_04980 [Gemmobacter tilapiae]